MQVTTLVALLLYICFCAKRAHKHVWPETAHLKGPRGKAGGPLAFAKPKEAYPLSLISLQAKDIILYLPSTVENMW